MAVIKSLLILIFITLMTQLCSSIPNHRKARQVRLEDVKTISEEALRRMTPKRRQMVNYEYTKEFFRPLK